MSATSEPKLTPRPPIVVVMGHVDHGKTTLLDYIRKSNVAGKEAGGITQSVGAYEIVHTDRKITFIDTPGHEAFTKMRSRGASIADLAILVVAAEEGLKPQTKEVIKILNDTKTPFVVAINKVDKPEANIEKVKNELTGEGVLLEGYGGHVSFEPISAKTGQNVNELIDLILLAADYESLTYSAEAEATGFILEAKVDPRRGMEVTAIVKNGTLRQGDDIVTASAKGKVKILENFRGQKATELLPSSPALIIGFESLPQVGEAFTAGKNISTESVNKIIVAENRGITQANAQNENAIKFIVKASDSGSLEALSAIMKSLPCEKPVLILDESVGDIGDNDVKNAIASKAIIIGFKNKVSKSTKNLAEIQKVRILVGDIVYHLIKDIEVILMKPEAAAVTGRLEVLAVFSQAKLQKQLVGGKVVDGVMKNRANVEIHRVTPPSPDADPSKAVDTDPHLVGHGKIVSLQTGKLEVNQVEAGKECGFIVNSSMAIQKGDHIIIK
ncbi:MAG: translation initiation factor IF-2 [Parcubacteria group bacterium Gr01-1014_20]|nr:MAG: translation initiation factor IF-2 [Parcubacteria group bacterium Gr01-1014_20]